jgi:hypothetical protein
MSCKIENSTITFDDKVKGWTSFHSFYPDFMVSMNGNLFSFKNGDLYEHDSDEVPRNTFYGTQYPSKVSLMVNDAPSTIKELQAISLEGNYSWDSLITAYISNVDDAILSTIKEVEFVKKEGIWFAYARRNEDDNSYDSKSAYGIGVVTSVVGNTVVVNGWSDTLTFGDSIIKGSNLATIGSIQSVTRTNVTTLVLSSTVGLSGGDFIIGKKDSRTEGGKLRGYTIRIDLEIEKDNKVELFSVNSEVIKSFQ